MSRQVVIKDILKPLLYADIFDYPLTFEEIYKFLELSVSPATVNLLLEQAVQRQQIMKVEGFYCLAGKAHLIVQRQQRQQLADAIWPQAMVYGQWIASLPFVKMVAVTGSLAVDNPRHLREDIDYLIVTCPGRLWLCRAMIILLVKYVHRRGAHLCPNYILTEKLLRLEDNNLYTARELLQMVPLYGAETYRRMRLVNDWVTDYLPHGQELNLSKINDTLSSRQRFGKKWSQVMLRGAVGNLLESALRQIQVRKHTRLAQQRGAADRVIFTADQCKGHYDSHGDKTIQTYELRLKNYDL